jgi:glycosyltransferase involved in cell wall biosynthesis
MFSGRIVEGKIPEYFVEVVNRLIVKRKKLSVLVIGNGPLREKFLTSLKSLGVDLYYPGFIKQKDLPYYYSKAKVFLFTTICDAWGIVANEALASGTPVFTTPYAGVINDLVIDGYNGYILELDSCAWASKINEVLDDKLLLDNLRRNAKKSIEKFNYDDAAKGIVQAIEWAANKTVNIE